MQRGKKGHSQSWKQPGQKNGVAGGLGGRTRGFERLVKKKKIRDRKTHRETRGIEMASRHREREQLATGETDTYRHTDTKKSAWWCAGRVGV